MRKVPIVKDPAVYAAAVEFGNKAQNIEGRPLFRKTLEDFKPVVQQKVNDIRKKFKDAWS